MSALFAVDPASGRPSFIFMFMVSFMVFADVRLGMGWYLGLVERKEHLLVVAAVKS